MTGSLPKPADAAPRGRSALRDAGVNALTAVGLKVVPRTPDRLKRLLLGGRTVTIDGNTLDTTLQFLLTLQRRARIGGLVASDDPAVARRQLGRVAAMMPVTVHVATADTTIPGPAGPLPARHYRPPESAGAGGPAPLLVFYHGGGFVIGDIASHDGLCRVLCRDAGVHVLSVEYRLAPEHKAPAAVEDALAAYRWACDNAAALGADPARIAVGGDSAGGNLAAVVSQQVRDHDLPTPALQLLLYPATDMAHETRSRTLFADGFYLTKRDMDWFTDCYVGGAGIDTTDPRVSPMLARDLSGLAPALVVTAGFDPLRDEGNRYAELLRAAGVTVDLREFGSLIHAFANMFPLGGGSAVAVAEVASALRAHLARR
ncbi:alpha/beta hydrolase [Mycobacterium sp. MYCO198283]|uniref:alpha/beta hydrolase n=1 Tax=Mycobacterium sp. MYCO198283 TaxID=2883505 RepID=UPI001E4198DE|nr:alpha/beta hydrolase [Mycobacterium sp. MYCO198283]MCG5433713.1 alpha/beta hydrolase [Mycobacterium sp. MYCO198283]